MSRSSILIVDDNVTNIQVLNDVLKENYTIYFATSGQDALDIVTNEHPDLILLDIMMPEMDGYEVCTRLKRNQDTQNIPVIFVSAMTDVKDETRGLDVGAADYITKPISAPIVQARVKTHLNLVQQTKKIQQAYDELKSSQDQLLQQEKIASIGQLTEGLAHEINSPAQDIQINLKFFETAFNDLFHLVTQQHTLLAHAENDYELETLCATIENINLPYLTEEIPKAANQSLEGIQRILEIINALKQFSEPYSTQDSMVDVNSAIETIVDMSANIWNEHAELKMNLAPDHPTASAVAGEFSKVVLNLIVNATQAIEESENGVGKITITTAQEANWVYITVADTGEGISSENLTRIFIPFFTTKEAGKRTGLGLSVAYSIVEKNGGTLTVESDVGKGSIFTIKLKKY